MNTTRRMASAVLLCTAAALTAACGGNDTKSAAAQSPSAPALAASATTSASASTSTTSTAPAAPALAPDSGSGALGGLSDDAILAKATADTKAAPSLHLTSTGGPDGFHKLDLLIAPGKNCRTTLDTGTGTISTVKVGTNNWMMLDAATVKSLPGNSTAMNSLVGKYVTISGKDPQISRLCDVSTALEDEIITTTGLSKGPTTTVNGIKAVTLTSPSEQTILVSDTATPLILRIVTTGSDTGTANFSDYGQVPAITAPPASQIVTMPGR